MGGVWSSSPVPGCRAHRDGTGKLLAGLPTAPVVPGSCVPTRWARQALGLGVAPVCTPESASNSEERMQV